MRKKKKKKKNKQLFTYLVRVWLQFVLIYNHIEDTNPYKVGEKNVSMWRPAVGCKAAGRR